MLRHQLLTLIGAGLLAVAATVPSKAAASNPLALWQLAEKERTVLHDSSPNKAKGRIGTSVVLGGRGAGTSYFRWTYVAPNEPPANPQRLLQIADNRLNPGSGDYAMSFRYRTTRPFGNIVQKGQATTFGGQVKVELPQGQVTCLYRGSDGQRAIKSLARYNDGQWHTVRCERTAAAVALMVYDAAGTLTETRRINGPTGHLSNTIPVTVGGKLNCDQVDVTCDYFVGDIDWVRIDGS